MIAQHGGQFFGQASAAYLEAKDTLVFKAAFVATMSTPDPKKLRGNKRRVAGERRKVKPPAPSVLNPDKPKFWAIIGYQTEEPKGYYIDSVTSGDEEKASFEATAARQDYADRGGGYRALFPVRIVEGGRDLDAKKKCVYDVWLYTRNLLGKRKWEIKLAKYLPQEKGKPPKAKEPRSPGDEWESICIHQKWMRFDNASA